MQDSHGRSIEYLRISLTGRCNLACQYCHPTDTDDKLLTTDEIVTVCKAAARLGISKVRLTGGEPLVRTGLPQLIADIRNIEGINAVAITTNGVLLKQQLPQLMASGLTRVNVSLDTTQKELYKDITGKDCLNQVLDGIYSALEAHLPTRINCVPLYDTYKQQTEELATLARTLPLEVRFIELMPMGCAAELKGVANSELLAMLTQRYAEPKRCEHEHLQGPSEYFSFSGFVGKIGFISPMSHRFCAACNRVRLTKDGFLLTCLGCDDGVDLRVAMQRGEDILPLMQAAIFDKPKCHHFDKQAQKISMAQIGG